MTRMGAMLLSTQAALAIAAEPACCTLFGFDATSMLGENASVCGKIVTADSPNQARDESSVERQRAAQCALEAQRQGRAFVYTYRLLASPDTDLITQAVFGAHGERLLLRMGLHARENIRTVEACAGLTVLPDGLVTKQGCRIRHGILD